MQYTNIEYLLTSAVHMRLKALPAEFLNMVPALNVLSEQVLKDMIAVIRRRLK